MHARLFPGVNYRTFSRVGPENPPLNPERGSYRTAQEHPALVGAAPVGGQSEGVEDAYEAESLPEYQHAREEL